MADEQAGEDTERIAQELLGEGHQGSPQDGYQDTPDVPRCAQCNRPLDDIEGMEEAALLTFLRLGALKMLARNLQLGQLTHQELAVMRGLLRDNGNALTALQPEQLEDLDAAMPPANRTRIPQRRPRPDYGGTEG